MRPFLFGKGPELFEVIGAFGVRYNKMPWGSEFLQDPELSHLLVVCGPVCRDEADQLREVWEGMPNPKWSVAFGSSALTGGGVDPDLIIKDLEQIIPVHFFVPGAGTSQESLLEIIEKIQKELDGVTQ